jgi:4-hydroxybenzoate polyprenyltransferase
MNALRLFLREIRIEHTLFALPFAYVGALLAAHGLPTFHALLWITLAVLGARTAAMAANRYLDRAIDARNPRTASRAVASGRLPGSAMLWAIATGLLLLVLSAWMLNPLCLKLLPIAAAGVLVYPLCKRFTWLTHFVLGGVDALAPLGAYIAIASTVSWSAVLLFIAVLFWVAGFDVIYALMDLRVDREQNLRSIPARFGEARGRRLAIGLHLVTALALGAAGYLSNAPAIYYLGVAASLALAAYEERLLRTVENLFVLNERVFALNMSFSVLFFATTLAGAIVSR